MKAIVISDGSVGVGELPMPEPTGSDLLVRVSTAGVNRADVAQLDGKYHLPPGVDGTRPGLELCGEVVTVGPAVHRFAVGQRVMALLSDGAQSEYAVVCESLAMEVPPGITPEVAGGVPEAFVTAHDALFTQMRLRLGERVLIHGAAGGVGCAAVQLARQAGATVVATVRRESLRSKVAALGATAIAPEQVRDHGPFDAVLETIGAANIADDLACLATGGRIAVVGVTAGSVAQVDLRALMTRRGAITASTLRARSLAERAIAVRETERAIAPLLRADAVSVPVMAVYARDDVADAYEAFRRGGKFGKIVIRMGSDDEG